MALVMWGLQRRLYQPPYLLDINDPQERVKKAIEFMIGYKPKYEPEVKIDYGEWVDAIWVTNNTYTLLVKYLEVDELSMLLTQILYGYINEDGFYPIYKIRWGLWDLLSDVGYTAYNFDVTANYENILSNELQYGLIEVPIETEEGEEIHMYLYLQIHQGGDVRANYSWPFIFYVGDEENYLDFLRGTYETYLFCSKCHGGWLYICPDGLYHGGGGSVIDDSEVFTVKNDVVIHKGCGGKIDGCIPVP